MAQTRLLLNENTWKRLENSFPEAFLPQGNSSECTRVHCVIPLCIGYSPQATVAFDKLEAWLEDITKKGFTYIILKDPKDPQSMDQWENDFAIWKKTHPESILNKLTNNQMQSIEDMRKTDGWNNAFDIVQKINWGEKIQQDVNVFQFKHEGANSDASILHIKKTTADYLSWIKKNKDWEKQKEITVLFYEHGLSQTMKMMERNAHNYDYVADSIIHIKPKCDKVLVTSNTVENQQKESVIRTSSIMTEGLSTLLQMMIHKNAPPQCIGPTFLHAFVEAQNLVNQPNYPLVNEQIKETEKHKASVSSQSNLGKYSVFKTSSMNKGGVNDKRDDKKKFQL